jgi:hypothetical protein
MIVLNFFFDSTETPSPQRLHGEPSPSQRRRFAKTMPSLRQLVESKGTLQSIHKCGSEKPIKRFNKSAKAMHRKHSTALLLEKISEKNTSY